MSRIFNLSKPLLEEALKQELPGRTAHESMLPKGRSLLPDHKPNTIKQSAVLLLVFEKEGELHLCLTKRTANMKHHPGQISFPGGRCEPEELVASETALRETEEEIGIAKTSVQLLGKLSELYVSASNYNIHPYLGWYNGEPRFKPHCREVAEIILLPFSVLFDEKSIQKHHVQTSIGELQVPCYFFEEHVIWGATAMIIAELASLLKQHAHRPQAG